MTIASALTALNTDIVNARTAITNKGGTVTANGGTSQLATDIATIPTGGGSTGKYQLLERIKDDNNNEIGTVSGFFTDANDVEYAVVCLDARYRVTSKQWCSNTGTVTNMPVYSTAAWGTYESKETATQNCNLILDFCTSKGYTSSAVSYCRGFSFVIGGKTYYGQLPNAMELVDICKNHTSLNNLDITAGSYSSFAFDSGKNLWASSQFNSSSGWYMANTGSLSGHGKATSSDSVAPILEIPNTVI